VIRRARRGVSTPDRALRDRWCSARCCRFPCAADRRCADGREYSRLLRGSRPAVGRSARAALVRASIPQQLRRSAHLSAPVHRSVLRPASLLRDQLPVWPPQAPCRCPQARCHCQTLLALDSVRVVKTLVQAACYLLGEQAGCQPARETRLILECDVWRTGQLKSALRRRQRVEMGPVVGALGGDLPAAGGHRS